jgi:hypothetical protein
MSIFTIILLIAVSVAGFFVWANHKTQRRHARYTQSDVVKALEEIISPNSETHDTWDLFLNWHIDDPYLESIRQKCLRVVRDCPPQTSTEDISRSGIDHIRSILEELHRAPNVPKR